MKLAVVGTGYVGLVSGVCFSELGHDVICVDQLESKIEQLQQGKSPIYEPALDELIQKNIQEGRLKFTTRLSEAVQASDVIVLAVGTPSLPDGRANLNYIEQAAKEVGEALNSFKIIVIKSTVPVGTNERVHEIVSENTMYPFEMASVPEFLREGTAVSDTFNPDRIIIGTSGEVAKNVLVELHKPLTEKIMITDIRSAEMIKYASNAFLATKISFINEIANICEKVGADVTQVALGMGQDKRIGGSFLKAGIGFGGSCLPKDTQALIQIAGQMDYDFKLLKSVVEVNHNQRFNIITKLESKLMDLSNKTIALWGLAFKPETDDVRDSPAFEIIQELLKRGAVVRAYDPIAVDNFKRHYKFEGVNYTDSPEESAKEADALCILTDWKEFRDISPKLILSWLTSPILIDGRNIYSDEEIINTELHYDSIGRPNLIKGNKEQKSMLLL
ncbi:UDP-glucose/GDP-mannose dehydrogenase family protein [Paenibacillus cellulositrophicus]|uniref:UDP-glucose dehydrogenase family protein n=1 Tax=Paenibacillus cellulositrophicus TaxID=562959 RepID=UPI0020411092|nr:UDP-glucose/GDP-mannose dehydrogenase family protein [Paenibacillus cellulositrophicus]MCM2996630.1 UDP-glucose/GDP-mannose dehydrogenase family protein [Paenibacillus cellulositrophicus]